jgi:hypothetical protein
MKTVFGAAMRHATKLTRAQNVIEATREIQRALSGRGRDVSPDQQTGESPRLIPPPTNGAESADASEQPPQDARIERGRSLRIPTKPAMHSNLKPATYTDLKPATVPI